MPNQGPSIRFEERIFPEQNPLSEKVHDILQSELPFRTAMDLLEESKGSDNQSNKETEWPL
ncbi:MAG TPA: hypothetical protein VN703_03725 [Candidatus Sulfopaludibacter sp.]|nr:hypothetical protein [Candidatus Sulfopaludibacter sp.]